MTQQEQQLLSAFNKNTPEKRIMILKLAQRSAETFNQKIDHALSAITAASNISSLPDSVD